MRLPNLLTLLRILLTPVLVGAFYLLPAQLYLVPAALVLLAGATDFLDGYLARRWQQTSLVGAILDPLADKLLVVTALLLLLDAYGAILLVIVLPIVLRELLIAELRQLATAQGLPERVAVGWQGRLKNFAQLSGLVLLFAAPSASSPLWYCGFGILLPATLWTCVSAVTYFRRAASGGIHYSRYFLLRLTVILLVALGVMLLVWSGASPPQVALATLLLCLALVLPTLGEWRAARQARSG